MSLSLSGESRDFLQKLHAKAEEFGHEFILPEHLLFLFTETPVTEEIFESFQVPPGEIRAGREFSGYRNAVLLYHNAAERAAGLRDYLQRRFPMRA